MLCFTVLARNLMLCLRRHLAREFRSVLCAQIPRSARWNLTRKFRDEISGRFESCYLQLPKLCDLIAQRSGLFKLQRGRGVEHLLAKLLYDLGALGGWHLL